MPQAAYHTLERDLAGREAIQRILSAAGVDGAQQVIDYGGGRGVWSYGFPSATVYEPLREEWGPAREGVTFTDSLDGIEPADAILLVNVQQILPQAETVKFLDFAREHVKPDGRVLVSVASRWIVTEWMLRREQPLRRYPWLVWQIAQSLRPGYAGAYCTRPRTLIRLAEKHGLRHVDTLSRDVDRDYEQMIGCNNTGRWFHWLVFTPGTPPRTPA